jgi:cysteine desulfurase/selenocysteine lyase
LVLDLGDEEGDGEADMSVTSAADLETVRREQFPVTREWTWFNTATFGPLPVCNVETQTAFLRGMSLGESAEGVGHWWEGADSVRAKVGQLINCNPDDVAFLKSTGEGVSLVALGLDWRPGDEVVTYDQEFPSDVYPWLALERKGVVTRFVRDAGRFRFEAEDVEKLIGPRTRVVCLSLVNNNNGFRAPIEQIAEVCRARGVWLVVDAVQAAGCMTVDAGSLGADLIAAHGYKTLCAGYGIAFCYVSPALRDAIEVPEPGWKSIEQVTNITRQTDYKLEYAVSARRYESGVQNISGMYGMGASIDLFSSVGLQTINDHVLGLSGMVTDRLEEKGYRVVSSRRPGEISCIVSVTHPRHEAKQVEAALSRARVACAVREGRVRISSHLFNNEDDVAHLVDALP